MAKMQTGRKEGPTLKNCVLTENGKKRVLEPEECREMQKKMFGKSDITDAHIAYAKRTKGSAKAAQRLREEEAKKK
jgi:hypothetical protein